MSQSPSSPPRRSASGFSPGSILVAVDRAIARFEGWVLAYGVLLMALNTVANVVARRLGQSFYFTEELNQFLMVLITFVGIGYAARRARHIRMSAVYDELGHGAKKAMTIVIALITAVFMLGLAYYSLVYVIDVADRGRVTPALQIPLYVTYVWLPVGFLISGIQYLLAIYRNLTEPEIYLSFEEQEGYEDVDQAPQAL
ncbi:MAG: TRAP transporter small permease [Rhodospirillaceae bacterium]|nr:TRAP transporter small permease [Rhodospirillaceae bacterium]